MTSIELANLAMSTDVFHRVESASRLVANLFVSGLWQGAVLAVAVGVCLRLLPKTTAAMRFAIWTAVFAVLVALPMVHANPLHAASSVHAVSAVKVDARWSFVIAGLWLLVSMVRGAKLAVSAIRLRRIWRRAVPVEGYDEVLRSAGVRGVKLCTSADVDRPSVIGFFSPRILVPQEIFAQLTAAELEQIVLHEIGHLRRADDWINLLQKLSLVLVPLNPVLIWVERQLCLERELACDDDVLRLTKAPKAYATCLTNLAEHRLGRSVAALSLGAWEKQSELTQRVHSILRGSEGMGRTQARVVLGIVVLGLLGGSVELARCPELVSFSQAAAPLSAQAFSPARAEVRGVGYQPVSFHAMNPAAHETLLKASMPVNASNHPLLPMKKLVSKRHSHAMQKTTTRSLQSRVDMQTRRTQGWVMLTSWQEPVRHGTIVATDGYRQFSISYAAVPTPAGWLVIQL